MNRSGSWRWHCECQCISAAQEMYSRAPPVALVMAHHGIVSRCWGADEAIAHSILGPTVTTSRLYRAIASAVPKRC